MKSPREHAAKPRQALAKTSLQYEKSFYKQSRFSCNQDIDIKSR